MLLPFHGLDYLCHLSTHGLRHQPARYGRRCRRRRGRRGLAVSTCDLCNPYGANLEERLLGDGVPLGYGQFVGRPRAAVRRVSTRLVEVPVVEWREEYALPDPADTGLRLQASARGLDPEYVALSYPETF